MSDHAVQPRSSGSEMSRKYLNEKQSAWMGHWLQPKHRRATDDSLENKDRLETKQHFSLRNQESEPSGSNGLLGLKEGAGSQSSGDGSHSKKDRPDLLPFPISNIHKNGGSNNDCVPGTQTGQCSELKAATTETILNLPETKNATMGFPNLELELRAHDSVESGCMPDTNSSRGKLLGVPSSYPYGIMYRKQNITPFASTSKKHVTHHSSYQDFNIDTVRMKSTLNAREDIHLGLPVYAERTRHFCITEKMAIGVSEEGKMFRESILSANFNGNVGGFLSLSSASGQVQPRLKLQILDGSTDSEQIGIGSEENKKDEASRSIGRLYRLGDLTDETSAARHTMEAAASLENNHAHGLGVSMSNKAALREQATVSSQGKSANTWLPDMNEVAQASDGSANEGEHSTSRTQSLDMECLVSNNNVCASNSKSMPSHVVLPRAELGSRWVKRLKLSGSCTKSAALGTKSSTIEEASSYEKLRKLPSNLFNGSIDPTNSQPTTEGKGSSKMSLKEDRNALLSHSWIRRWLHDQTASSKKLPISTEANETLKASYDQFEKKTFPSIAAMALMGKAMNGFRPCEFTKKGSFIVWNTNVQQPSP